MHLIVGRRMKVTYRAERAQNNSKPLVHDGSTMLPILIHRDSAYDNRMLTFDLGHRPTAFRINRHLRFQPILSNFCDFS